MFKLGENYYTKAGYPALIVATDAIYVASSKVLPVVALVTLPANVLAARQVCYFYSEDGKLGGSGNEKYDLVSNEPTKEELALIDDMSSLCRGDFSDREKNEKMLKVIRALRNKQ